MKFYRICAIGHRFITRDDEIESAIEKALFNIMNNNDIVEAYVGRNGDFDILFARVFRSLRKKQEHFGSHSISLVLPYHVKDEEFYTSYYNDVIIPIPSSTHFKVAITERNIWMIDNCDLLICYVTKECGGAFQALEYAKSISKPFYNLASYL